MRNVFAVALLVLCVAAAVEVTRPDFLARRGGAGPVSRHLLDCDVCLGETGHLRCPDFKRLTDVYRPTTATARGPEDQRSEPPYLLTRLRRPRLAR